MKIPKVCLNCNKSFEIFKCREKNNVVMFCSKECFNEYKIFKHSVEKICNTCGKFFRVRKCDLGKKRLGKYCSKLCSQKGVGKDRREQRPLNTCGVCGRKFYIKKSHREKYNNHTCSKECMAKDYRLRMAGESNPNYKDGRAIDTKAYSKVWGKMWRGKNIEKVRAYNQNRRSRRKNAVGNITKTDIQKKLISQKNKCWWCMQKLKSYHVDHVIPLVKGGEHSPRNTVISCPTCNMRKGAKLPQEFAGRFF